MKIAVEIDIDWINEDQTLDNEVSQRIESRLVERLEKTFTDEAGKQIAKKAERLITAKTDLLINTILEKPVVISNGWDNKKEYDSIYDMVEQSMKALYDKEFDSKSCNNKDPLLNKLESYIKSENDRQMQYIERHINKKAKEVARNTLEESNLFKSIETLTRERFKFK